MPVFSKLLWPFNSNATPAASTHDTSSAHQRSSDNEIAREEQDSAYTMSAALDSGQADMEVAIKVESVKKGSDMQPKHDMTQDADGAVYGGEHETSASGTVHAGAGDKSGSRDSRSDGPVEDRKDGEQALSQVPDKMCRWPTLAPPTKYSQT
jgi:hypothetical protein